MEAVMDKIGIEKYPTYKDSGVEWLCEIPEHWQMLRVKNIFQLIVDSAPKNNSCELLSVYTDIGVRPRKELEERGNKASTTDGYWCVKKGDIVVNKLLAWMGAIGVSNYDGVTSPAYDILRSRKPIDSNFYHYLFRTESCISELKKNSRGIMEMRLRLYFDKFGDVRVPYPPKEEQTKIVKFINRKTAQIDKAISQKEKLIELLKERRQILIHNAVTRGLDPNVKMKDSRVEWIGEIPEHWEVRRMKFLCHITTGARNTEDKVESGLYPFFVRSQTPERINSYSFDGEAILTAGDGAGVGKVFHYMNGKFDFHQRVYKFSNFKNVDGFYLFHYIQSNFHNVALLGTAKSTVDSLRLPLIQDFLISYPNSKEEQKFITSYIEKIEKKIEAVIALKSEEIEKLKEYKATLINAAVTGKIKVC